MPSFCMSLAYVLSCDNFILLPFSFLLLSGQWLLIFIGKVTMIICWHITGFGEGFGYFWFLHCSRQKNTGILKGKWVWCDTRSSWGVNKVSLPWLLSYVIISREGYLMSFWWPVSCCRFFIGGSVLYYPQLSSISSYQLYVEVSMI